MNLPLADLTVGTVYRLRARNLRYGVWTGATFIGLREKFGDIHLDECEVPGYTAWAIEPVGEIDPTIRLRTTLGSICDECKRPAHWSGPPAPAPWVHDDDRTETNSPIAVSNRALFIELQRIEKEKEDGHYNP